jgi:hypothetical protein
VDEGRHGSQVVMPLPPVSRRDYLKALVETTIFAPALISSSEVAADPSLPPLPILSESEALLLTPRDHRFELYQPAYAILYSLCACVVSRSVLQPYWRSTLAEIGRRHGLAIVEAVG